MARGNWRNWDGREGADSSPRIKVPTRPAECHWCGHTWSTRVPKDPVCPKCNLSQSTVKYIFDHPEEERFLSQKAKSMKKR